LLLAEFIICMAKLLPRTAYPVFGGGVAVETRFRQPIEMVRTGIAG
jgi:hypothetical protein